MRIRLLDALRDGPLTIDELTEVLGASQQNVSKHVGVLAQAGIAASPCSAGRPAPEPTARARRRQAAPTTWSRPPRLAS